MYINNNALYFDLPLNPHPCQICLTCPLDIVQICRTWHLYPCQYAEVATLCLSVCGIECFGIWFNSAYWEAEGLLVPHIDRGKDVKFRIFDRCVGWEGGQNKMHFVDFSLHKPQLGVLMCIGHSPDFKQSSEKFLLGATFLLRHRGPKKINNGWYEDCLKVNSKYYICNI